MDDGDEINLILNDWQGYMIGCCQVPIEHFHGCHKCVPKQKEMFA